MQGLRSSQELTCLPRPDVKGRQHPRTANEATPSDAKLPGTLGRGDDAADVLEMQDVTQTQTSGCHDAALRTSRGCKAAATTTSQRLHLGAAGSSGLGRRRGARVDAAKKTWELGMHGFRNSVLGTFGFVSQMRGARCVRTLSDAATANDAAGVPATPDATDAGTMEDAEPKAPTRDAGIWFGRTWVQDETRAMLKVQEVATQKLRDSCRCGGR